MNSGIPEITSQKEKRDDGKASTYHIEVMVRYELREYRVMNETQTNLTTLGEHEYRSIHTLETQRFWKEREDKGRRQDGRYIRSKGPGVG